MEKSEIGDRRFTDARGTTYIAPSKRADGSWRKERRVKPGYVPPEEVAAYKAPGMKVKQQRRGPVGMVPTQPAKPKAQPKEKQQKKTTEEKRKELDRIIAQKEQDEWIAQKMQESLGISEASGTGRKAEQTKDSSSSLDAEEKEQIEKEVAALSSEDVKKRIKKVKKLLSSIETIEKRIAADMEINPDQQEKLKRKAGLEYEMGLLDSASL